jgi:hypothetical protein
MVRSPLDWIALRFRLDEPVAILLTSRHEILPRAYFCHPDPHRRGRRRGIADLLELDFRILPHRPPGNHFARTLGDPQFEKIKHRRLTSLPDQ